MMNKLFLPIIALVFSTSINAQQFYFRGGVGYTIAHGGVAQSTVSNNTSSVFPIHGSFSSTQIPGTDAISFDLKRNSFSAGVQGVLAVGAMFSKNIGVDMAVNLGLATPNMESSVYLESPELRQWLITTQKADMPVFITPSLVIQSDTGSRITAYARGGIVLPAKAGMTQSVGYTRDRFNIADSTWVRSTADWTEDFSMRFNPGVSGSIGMKYKTKKGAMLWAELYLLSMNLYLRQSELTSYDENGVSRLGSLTQDQKITDYEFKANTSGNSNTAPTYHLPYSNFGIHVGVMVNMN